MVKDMVMEQLKWTNGAKYVGDWVNGKREGLGKHIFPSIRFTLPLDNGRREGFGCRYFCNGDRFEGNWKRDKKHGPGSYIYAHGRRTINYHEHGKLEENVPAPQLFKVYLFCVLSRLHHKKKLVEGIDTALTLELAAAVRTYRRNELKIIPEEPTTGIMNQLQTMFLRFSRLSRDKNSNPV